MAVSTAATDELELTPGRVAVSMAYRRNSYVCVLPPGARTEERQRGTAAAHRLLLGAGYPGHVEPDAQPLREAERGGRDVPDHPVLVPIYSGFLALTHCRELM